MRRKPKFFRAPDTGSGTGTGSSTETGTDTGSSTETGTDTGTSTETGTTPDPSERIQQLEAQVKKLQSDLAKATVNKRNQKTDPEKTPDEIVMEGLSAWAAHNYDPAKLAE